MSRLAIVTLVFGLTFARTPTLCGQELIFGFTQDRDTYTWSDSLVWEPAIGSGTPLLLSNNSNATLIRETFLPDKEDRLQEDYVTRCRWRIDDDGRLRLTAVFENDYRSFEGRKVVDNSVGIEAVLRPTPGLILTNIGSFLMDSRSSYGNRFGSNGYQNRLEATYGYRVSPATAIDVDFGQDLKALKSIPESSISCGTSFRSLGSSDSIRVKVAGEYHHTKYFTTPQSFDWVSTQEKSIAEADLLLSWTPDSATHLRLVSSLDYQRFDYTLRHDEIEEQSLRLFGSDNSSRTVDYKLSAGRRFTRRIKFETHYMFRELREHYDILSGRQTVSTGELRCAVRSNPGIIDSAWIEAIFSVTGYTSDKASPYFSDRDRILQLYSLGFAHHLSRCLALRFEGSYRDYHQTYVSGALSANNNHNTIYVASPEIRWRPLPWLVVTNGFLLHANYTWYDHEKQVESERNTLFRRVRWRSEYAMAVSRRLTISPSYGYKYEDFGQLYWRDQWVQKTNWFRKTHLPSIELDYRPFESLTIAPGVSYEWKKSWEFTGTEEETTEKIARETFTRTTIHFDLSYAPGPHTSITASYLRRVQKSDLFADDITNQYIVSVRRLF